jgi:C1A family cysteine protease
MWRVLAAIITIITIAATTEEDETTLTSTSSPEIPIPSLDLSTITLNYSNYSNIENYNFNETEYNEIEIIGNISLIIESSSKSNIKSKKKTYKSKFIDYIKSRNYKKKEYYELIKNSKKSSIEDKFELFIDSDDYINELNANLSEPMYGHNKFSDWSMEEKQSLLMKDEDEEDQRRRLLGWCNLFDGWGSGVSSSKDFRSYAQPIQDQGTTCGACWAFASVAQHELNYYLYEGIWQKQSEQHVLDCSDEGDCNGGQHYGANIWLKDYGSCPKYGYYFYDGKDSSSCISCWKSKTPTTNAYTACITELSTGKGSESYGFWSIIANAAQYVSLSFGMKISNDFFHLKSLYNSSSVNTYYYKCNTNDMAPDSHAMSIYGVSSNGNYLLVRNSWGDDWGDDGYFWLYYGAADSCDFKDYVSFNYWS